MPAAKPPPRTGESSPPIPNGRKSLPNPKRTARSWRSLLSPYSWTRPIFHNSNKVDIARQAHQRLLVEQLRKLEDRLREGGGRARIDRQHRAGKMTARERIA